MLIFLLFITVGCSNRVANYNNEEIQYQRFLSEKGMNQLNQELDSYDKK